MPDEAGGRGDLDPGDHLGDAGGDLDQAETEGVELSVTPERAFGCQVPQTVHQPVGGGVDQQAELVGGGLGAGGAVGGQMELVSLDQVLRLAARAIDLFIEHRPQSFEIGDDEPGIDTQGRGLAKTAGDRLGITLGAVAPLADLIRNRAKPTKPATA